MLAAASRGIGQELAGASPGLSRVDALVNDTDLQRLAYAAGHRFAFCRQFRPERLPFRFFRPADR